MPPIRLNPNRVAVALTVPLLGVAAGLALTEVDPLGVGSATGATPDSIEALPDIDTTDQHGRPVITLAPRSDGDPGKTGRPESEVLDLITPADDGSDFEALPTVPTTDRATTTDAPMGGGPGETLPPGAGGPDTSTPEPDAHYGSCADAEAAGAAPIHWGQPGYRAGLDRDGDGIACEVDTPDTTEPHAPDPTTTEPAPDEPVTTAPPPPPDPTTTTPAPDPDDSTTTLPEVEEPTTSEAEPEGTEPPAE